MIDKPHGWTSFDVVAKVRGILRQANKDKLSANYNLQSTTSPKVKVGHTGTLDPLATGLMLVVVGDYCKRAEEFSKLDKTYTVTMKLGQNSTTGDGEGEKVAVSDAKPTQNELSGVLKQFVGNIMQVPPAFSAIKVNGQRAYKMARAGQDVKLEARPVHVESIKLESYAYPEVWFTAHVGSGTYIRSLVSDIGEKLQTGAYMTALERTSVGKWNLSEALQMDSLSPETIEAKLQEAKK